MEALAFLIVVLITVVIPMVLVGTSRRVHGGPKAVWLILTFLFGWFTYLAFLLIERLPEERPR